MRTRLPYNVHGMLLMVLIKPLDVCVLKLLRYFVVNKAYYTPHVDTGDYIIVTNCEKIVLTGKKIDQKIYDTFSGYPGGRKEEVARNLINRRPEVVIERAVKGMLPKNRLGRKMYKKLFVYVGASHPHTAQQPKELKF